MKIPTALGLNVLITSLGHVWGEESSLPACSWGPPQRQLAVVRMGWAVALIQDSRIILVM